MRTKTLMLCSLLIALSLVLSACGEQEVTRVITEKETIVETVKETVVETVKETVIVAGTPEVREVEVTREVVSEVEVVVTATPPPEAEKEVELVYGDLPRDQTFIVASQAPQNDVWDDFWRQSNNGTGERQLTREMPFLEWNGVIYPWLAQSWEYNEDATEMTLTITEGVTWNDGTPLTMEDWLFSIDWRINDPVSSLAALFEGVEWEAQGSNQIVFKLETPNWRFHQRFIGEIAGAPFYPWPKHIWENVDYEDTEFRNNPPVWSGPYRLVSTNPETRVVIWERRDDYWDPDRMPAPKYQVWIQRPPPDVAVFEWEDGNYDLGRLPFPMVPRVMAANSDAKNLVHPDPCPRGLVFNADVPPMDDPAFRHALALLVPQEKVAALANVPSYANKVLWPYSGEPDTKFWDPAVAEEYDVGVFDPEKAAQVLDEAGYELVDGRRVDKDGNPISLEAVYIDIGDPAWTVWAWLLSEQADKIGLEINPQLLEIPTFFANGPTGEFDILFRWFCVRPSDPIAMYDGLHSQWYAPIGESSGGIPGRYQNPEMDAVIDQLRISNPDDPATAELFKQAYEIWARDKPYVPLFGENEGVVFNERYWTGLEVGQPWVHWDSHFRQMLTYIEPAQ